MSKNIALTQNNAFAIEIFSKKSFILWNPKIKSKIKIPESSKVRALCSSGPIIRF